MSQGQKRLPEDRLFLVANEIYGHIPRDHFYERLGPLLQLEFVRELTQPLYQAGGRPSLDPVVFFKCLFIGFFENIIYDTELEYRIADSLTLRRFLGYALDERTPDESTLRKTRQRMPAEVFDQVFRKVLDQCQQAGLLKGRALGLDSTQVDANASMDSLKHKTLQCTYEQYILALRRQDQPDATAAEAQQADRPRTGKASNAVWESTTDPEARVMQHADGHTHLSYRVDATVDLETGIITSASAEFANVSDQADFLPRVDEAVAALAERGLGVVAIVADKGHHSGENLAGLAEREVVGLIASPRPERGQPGFQRKDFVYDAEADVFRCPEGVELRRRKLAGGAKQYQARGSDCKACPHFGTCTSSRTGRSLRVAEHEELIQANRKRVHSAEARPLLMIRRQRGEAPFGYFKQFGGLRRFAGRGLAYAQRKVLIAAAGFNLIKLLRKTAQPAPAGADPAAGAPQSPFGRHFGVLRALWGGLRAVWRASSGTRGGRRPKMGYGSESAALGPIPAQMTPISGGC
jgi:transposase